MTRDFYDTLAQVLPVLMLALIWDSAYLDRLRGQRRASRRIDPQGVRLWTKPRVRVFIVTVAAVVMISLTLTIFVLADLIPDSTTLRIILTCGLIFVLSVLMTRIYYDVRDATATSADTAEAMVTEDPGSNEIDGTKDSGNNVD